MESYPRQCRVPGGRTFVEDILEKQCRTGGGNWNNCSSRCRLDAAGSPDAVCPAVCEPLCECGGIAGFSCPSGYVCKTPAGIADALGSCVPTWGTIFSLEQVRAIAGNSSCSQTGRIGNKPQYNQFTRTWWIDLDPYSPQGGCNPACVIARIPD
jgi:hypothetical protein